MCRIVGYINKSKKSLSKNVLIEMRDTLIHGGPDDAGVYYDANVALGHRRLSILDLSFSAHQPMINEDGNFVIVYNGEVYNFEEIKRELIQKGYKFKSNSDSEVVLKSYIEWKEKCLYKFHGMFAIAIYDRKNNNLFLARDRVGVKPLYFYNDENIFMFSSELKAFHKNPFFYKKLSFKGLNQFLKYSYIPAPYTIFENTYKLKPGTYLNINTKTFEIEEKIYWNPRSFYEMPKLNINYHEAVNELERILINSFNLRMVSDVPVGMFLSGGVDSSSLLALLSKNHRNIKTFTIGFKENEFNEAEYAKEYAKYFNTEHYEYYLSKQDALNVIPLLPDIWDEPFADASQIPTYLVSKFTKEHVTVSLSADGGDELFFGYPKYWLTKNRVKTIEKYKIIFEAMSILNDDILAKLGNSLNIGDKLLKTKKVLKGKYSIFANAFDIGQHIYMDYYQNKMFLEKFYKDITNNFSIFDEIKNNSNEERMLLIDFITYLPDDILTKVDRATMAVSLEGREPFLDQNIFEFVARLPFEYKYKYGTTKRILRDILYKYIPKELVERPKMGFGIPLEQWCKEDINLSKLLKEQLSKERIKKDGIFEYSIIENELNKYFSGKKVSFNKIWTLFIFQMWYDRWMK